MSLKIRQKVITKKCWDHRAADPAGAGSLQEETWTSSLYSHITSDEPLREQRQRRKGRSRSDARAVRVNVGSDVGRVQPEGSSRAGPHECTTHSWTGRVEDSGGGGEGLRGGPSFTYLHQHEQNLHTSRPGPEYSRSDPDTSTRVYHSKRYSNLLF